MTFARAEANAEGVVEMVDLLRAFRNGTASRADVVAWTRKRWSGGQGGPFPGNAPASTVFASIYNIEQIVDGEHVVRTHDIDSYIRWLEEGAAERFVQLTTLKCDMAAVAERVRIPATRAWIDGLGWVETIRFGSPFTGRAFLAVAGMMYPNTPASIEAPHGHALADCLEDVLETFAIDLDDLDYLDGNVTTTELRRWELWRQDDNGIKQVIRTFSGRRKAAALAAELEQQGHKQLYWVKAAEH